MKLLITTLSVFITLISIAQRPKKVTINVPGIGCEECGDIIYNRFNKAVDGVIAIEVKWKSKIVRMTYIEDRIDLNDIKVILANIGFDTDEEVADSTAKARLPKCCQYTPPAKVVVPPPAPTTPPPPPTPKPTPKAPATPAKPAGGAVSKPAVSKTATTTKKKG